MLAVAQELRRADPGGDVVIVGREGGVAEALVAEAGFRLETLRIGGVDVSAPLTVLRFLVQLPGAVRASGRLIASLAPDVVVGGAGYVSVPVVLAARRAGVPVVLLEQNALPGRATRLLARRATAVATAFASTAARLPVPVVHTGNPIRHELLEVPVRPLGARAEHLLVQGGSQGARRLNRALVAALPHLLERRPELRISHQTGRLEAAEVAAAAASLPAAARGRYTALPFIDDVGSALNLADIVLMRAGGSSLAEAAAFGRPLLLVPYPHAGGHQRFNAAPFVTAGAARIIPDEECDGPRVLAEVEALLDDPERWRAMAAASARLGRRDAAERVVRLVEEVADRGTQQPGTIRA